MVAPPARFGFQSNKSYKVNRTSRFPAISPPKTARAASKISRGRAARPSMRISRMIEKRQEVSQGKQGHEREERSQAEVMDQCVLRSHKAEYNLFHTKSIPSVKRNHTRIPATSHHISAEKDTLAQHKRKAKTSPESSLAIEKQLSAFEALLGRRNRKHAKRTNRLASTQLAPNTIPTHTYIVYATGSANPISRPAGRRQ